MLLQKGQGIDRRHSNLDADGMRGKIMTEEAYGTTHFSRQEDWGGKTLIKTQEGSSIAVPTQDLLMYVAAYARGQMAASLDRLTWQEVLGQRKGK
jgi:hypothetical protein